MGYSDPRWGVRQIFRFETTGALNGTVASATEHQRTTLSDTWPTYLHSGHIMFTAGGTEASKCQIVVGKSLAGTGTMSALGTATLGTQAIASVQNMTLTGTLTAGDDLIMSVYGTNTDVYDVIVCVEYSEQFDAGVDQ